MGKKKSTPEPPAPATFRRLAEPLQSDINLRPTTLEAQAKRLLAIHRLGSILRKYIPQRSAYGKNQFTELAEAIERRPNWLYKVWRFAGTYDKKELEGLCERPISWTHVIALLSLDKAQRKKYQQMAWQRKWTATALWRALNTDFESLRGGGRPVRIPKDPADALLKLVGEGELWLRRCELVRAQLQYVEADAAAAVEELADEAATTLRKISRTAGEAARELKRVCS